MRVIQRELSDACDGNDATADANLAVVLPRPPRPTRWVPQRKAEVVAALRNGYLSLEEACERYALSIEECLTWQRGVDLFGLPGLQVNKSQKHRRVRARPAR
jgi:hypothetical protein